MKLLEPKLENCSRQKRNFHDDVVVHGKILFEQLMLFLSDALLNVRNIREKQKQLSTFSRINYLPSERGSVSDTREYATEKRSLKNHVSN